MLTNKARYALRAMQNLARSDGRFKQSHAIAAEEKLPFRYLDLILGQLRQAGLLESARGLHGGYRLSRPPHRISFGDILDAMGADLALLPCLERDRLKCPECASLETCTLRPILAAIQKHFIDELRTVTINRNNPNLFEIAFATNPPSSCRSTGRF